MKKLFESGKIGPLTIKNRAVLPPMQVLCCEPDGTPGPRTIAYYEERAKGGVGLIIVEAIAVDDINNRPWDHQMRITSDSQRTEFQRLTEAVHRHNCHVFVQLHHYGSKSAPTAQGPAWTSSEIPAVPSAKPGHKMTVEEIKITEQRFIDAAVRCQRAGFDGVELAGTHGYLLHQFISPYYNNRTDEYGGSTENRLRIYTELIQGIHAACGKNFPVSVRFPGDEFTHHIPGTFGLDEGVKIARILEAAGADVLNVSNGNNFNADANCEPYSYRQGWKKHVAKAVKEAVSIPVMATNTIKDPEWAEQLLEEGVSDFVCLGRALIADPMFMNKAAKGDTLGIRKCMGCMYCREQLYAQMPIQCALNPRAGCEYIYPRVLPKDGQGKNVVVLGGGPAGMESAIVMAQRGFAVTLFEKSGALGGSMNLADKGMYKERITRAVETLSEELARLNVDVRLNTAPALEAVRALDPALVISACGAKPIIPNVPGVDGENVTTSSAVIAGEKTVSGNVLIVGAGMTGLECAEKLCVEGCEVTIADMQPAVGAGMFSVITADLMSRITPHNPVVMTHHALKEICLDGAVLTNTETGSDVKVSADAVVLSLGVQPEEETANLWKEAFPTMLVVGDNVKSGRIPHAIKDAYIKCISVLREDI